MSSGNDNLKIIVAQKAIIYNENGEILTIRRSKTDRKRPLTWDLPGGDLQAAGIHAQVKTFDAFL